MRLPRSMRAASVLLGLLSSLLAPAVVASPLTLSMSNADTVAIMESAFGPKSTWPVVMAVDALPPGTMVDGKPVDESHGVFEYGPWTLNSTQQELLARGFAEYAEKQKAKRGSSELSTRSPEGGAVSAPHAQQLQERDSTHIQRDCYNYGNWVPTWQLDYAVSGRDNFCDAASGTRRGGTYSKSKAYYWNPDNQQWEHFIKQGGAWDLVYFQISQWTNTFDWQGCVGCLKDLIYSCVGRNADSAGGEWHWVKDWGCGPNCDQAPGCSISCDPNTCSCYGPSWPSPPWFTNNYLCKLQPFQ